MYDIKPEEILYYRPGHTYTCYVCSAAYWPGKRKYLDLLLRRVLLKIASFGARIDGIYACSSDGVDETPLRHLVKTHSFLPFESAGPLAWLLQMGTYNPSQAIAAYQDYISVTH
jgi:hypothetical protein